jgi:hypothetical protein
VIRNLSQAEWNALRSAADDHAQHLVNRASTGNDAPATRELAALNRALDKARQIAPEGE